ncbi:MAG: DUF1841 family protein [Gammaproteobacteria bacterium]
MLVQDRATARRFFIDVWRKKRQAIALEPLEEQIAGIIIQHPEYHRILEHSEALQRSHLPENGVTNPFLHMGLHLAVQEQLMTDRPQGILLLYQKGLRRFGDAHELEHRVMDCLAETLWNAQRRNALPDEADYLRCVQELVTSSA